MEYNQKKNYLRFHIGGILISSSLIVSICLAWMLNSAAMSQVQASDQLTASISKSAESILTSVSSQSISRTVSEINEEENSSLPVTETSNEVPEQGNAEDPASAEEIPAAFTWNEEPMTAKMYLTENCNQRVEPRVTSESQGILPGGTAVDVVAKTDKEFYKISNGTFISSAYLTTEPPVAASAPTVVDNNTPIKHDGTPRGILNAAPLNPRSTGYAQLDNKINSIFSQIFTPGMDTYSKVKACYDYLINNTSYATGMPLPGGFGDTSVEGSSGYLASAAMGCLETGKGSCNRYSAAFIEMMTVLGLDARYVDGQCTASAGGYTGHVWVEVYIGGTLYVFDPQVEDNISKGGAINYLRFCKTYDQVPGKYIK